MKLEKGYAILDNSTSTNYIGALPEKRIQLPDFKLNQSNQESHSASNNNNSSNPIESPESKKRKDREALSHDQEKKIKKTDDAALQRQESKEFLEAALKMIEEQEKLNSLGEFTQKEVTFSKSPEQHLTKLMEKSQELETYFDMNQNKLVIIGYEKRIEEFAKFVRELLENENTEDPGEFTQRELDYSDYLKAYKDELDKKAESLEVYIEYGGKKMIVAGFQKRIDEFVAFLTKREAEIQAEAEAKLQMETASAIKPEGIKSESMVSKDTGTASINKPEPKIEDSSKKIVLTPFLLEKKDQIEEKSRALDVIYELKDNEIILYGDPANQLELSTFLFELQGQNEEYKNGKVYDQKQISISDSIKRQRDDVEKKAKELGLVCDIRENKVFLGGDQMNITEFIIWLYEKEATSKKSDFVIPEESKTGEDAFVQKDINISTFHRGRQKEIEKKAEELELIIEFGYDIILTSGFQSKINTFVKYLYELESEAKRALYPKYWDFYEINQFSMFPVKKDSDEFKMVHQLFKRTMAHADIIKLERIQNRYLMDHYITMIQKRQELHPDESINRLLLFHGTRQTDPAAIYRNFDTGFDLQYAAYGAYGKGIYFARDASYSHGFAHPKSHGVYQMLMADVFVGKAYDYNRGGIKGQLVKPPDGYDSICVNTNGFYILYNNLHSYPLYLIEYRVNNNNMGGGLFARPAIASNPLFTGGSLFGNYYNYNPAPAPLFQNNIYNNQYNQYNQYYDDDEEDEDWDGEDDDEY